MARSELIYWVTCKCRIEGLTMRKMETEARGVDIVKLSVNSLTEVLEHAVCHGLPTALQPNLWSPIKEIIGVFASATSLNINSPLAPIFLICPPPSLTPCSTLVTSCFHLRHPPTVVAVRCQV
ncbi:hypothetical protein F0562_008188 [Nyssa sinensis]|uniref:Uncharacterized protein n=1 Tax=Nyssa sinensis TaxID=561372 RepID=A0A5J5A8I4_9ASTE|nr:hypothetical protein F0562_008188 [Nyssa sinensis]